MNTRYLTGMSWIFWGWKYNDRVIVLLAVYSNIHKLQAIMCERNTREQKNLVSLSEHNNSTLLDGFPTKSVLIMLLKNYS